MTTIYHNPKCSKSRESLQLLKDNSVEPTVIEYLKQFPSKSELQALLKKLNLPITDLIRFKETIAKDLNISAKDKKTDDAWLNIIIENPILLERPIIVNGNKAVIGRPPENILSII